MQSPAVGARTINPHPAVCEDTEPKTASQSCRPVREPIGKPLVRWLGRGRYPWYSTDDRCESASGTPSAEAQPPPARADRHAGRLKPPEVDRRFERAINRMASAGKGLGLCRKWFKGSQLPDGM